MARSTDAAVYRKAAELIAIGKRDWSCCAVEHANNTLIGISTRWSPPTARYQRMFSEEPGRMTISQFDNTGNGREVRVLALCFMAAMVAAGDA